MSIIEQNFKILIFALLSWVVYKTQGFVTKPWDLHAKLRVFLQNSRFYVQNPGFCTKTLGFAYKTQGFGTKPRVLYYKTVGFVHKTQGFVNY